MSADPAVVEAFRMQAHIELRRGIGYILHYLLHGIWRFLVLLFAEVLTIRAIISDGTVLISECLCI